MNPFYSALEQGYEPDEILGYISKAIPKMSSMIKQAKSVGYSTNQILGFISKNFDMENRKGMSESERHAANRRADAERTKYGLKIAASAVAAPIAGVAARSVLSRALPSSLQSLSPPLTPLSLQSNTSTNPNATHPSNIASAPTSTPNPRDTQISPLLAYSQQPPVSTNIQQPQISNQQELKPVNLNEIFSKNPAIKTKIADMWRADSSPEEIKDYFKKFNPSQTKKLEENAGTSIDNIVSQYIGELEQEPKRKLTRQEALGAFREKMIKGDNAKEIEKGSTVASPQGIGEIKEIRNGKAIIDVDGKKHQVEEDDLIESPIPEKELADLYDDLIAGIEKTTGKQVSRNVEWAGYDPKTNEVAYKPHGSDKLWSYDNIPSEDVEMLTNLLTKRKSTGENFIGAWEAGTESPIGAAMYQLIKKLQSERGGKGNEYRNRYETIYDALEPAKKASKERYAEKKKKAKKPRLD